MNRSVYAKINEHITGKQIWTGSRKKNKTIKIASKQKNLDEFYDHI